MRGSRTTGSLLLALGACTPGADNAPNRPVAGARTPSFTITDTSVRQGAFEAVAVSRDTIVSSYPRAAREAHYRFSINGLDNEFPSGTDHTLYLRPTGGRLVAPLQRYGVESAPPPPTPDDAAGGSEGPAQVTFRVDLRHVLDSLRLRGQYDPPYGDRITRGSPIHVYVRGAPEPLTWDLAALRPGSPHELTDPDGDGIYEGTIPIVAEYTRPRTEDGRAIWARQADIAGFPRLSSAQRLQDALYRMSLEELQQLIRDDGALSAGAKWPGVWTRDVALASVLGLVLVVPDAVRTSLLAKVDSSGRIIQDTGTGGSWPISTDRMVWALAAWELYAAPGDEGWLRQASAIIRRSAEADLHAARDAATGLFRGESSFLDWREQSYPRWMQPADIYASQNLGTNAVHYAAYRALANMARVLGEPHARWDSVAAGIRAGMDAHLWQEDRGWYGQYRYGRVSMALSPRAEWLGEALAVIVGAASPDRRATLMRRAPFVEYGAPVFWPYIAGERFYHNAAIWPFVTAYATWAGADAANTSVVQHGLDANTRAAALFLTNKENMVAATGHFEGTALNSDRQLWSVAATLAATYRVLLGMRLEPGGLVFRPMVPPSYGGERTVRGMRYRGATLDVTVRGHGSGVRQVSLDGRPIARAAIPADLTGAHAVEITMDGQWPADSLAMAADRFAPATPRTSLRGDSLGWRRIEGAVHYVVHRNGVPADTTTDTTVRVAVDDALAELQVAAVSATGDASFLSEPVRVLGDSAGQIVQPSGRGLERREAGHTGPGYLRLTTMRNTSVRVPVRVPRPGRYAVDVRYANGNGPVNTEDKAAIRTLLVDGDTAGVLVMPQRGSGRWADWGWSNPLLANLAAGAHELIIAYTPLDANMNRSENTALLDAVRLTFVAPEAAPPPRRPQP